VAVECTKREASGRLEQHGIHALDSWRHLFSAIQLDSTFACKHNDIPSSAQQHAARANEKNV